MNEEKYNKYRKINVETKMGAVWVSSIEVLPLLNLTAIAKLYFHKSQSWFSQRLHNCTVRHKSVAFKPEEFHTLAEAYRDIAAKLMRAADEIDAAADE